MIRETGFTQNATERSITLTGSSTEIDAIRAAMLGVCYIRLGDDKELERIERFTSLPSPIDDPQVPPKWTLPPLPVVGECTEEDITDRQRKRIRVPKLRDEIDPNEGWHSPSVIVSSVGAGTQFEEERRRAIQRMIDNGFECMRSRREQSGRFWELWYLPYANHATGGLWARVKLAGDDWRAQAHAVIDWLIENVPFGSADVCVQRAALCYD